MVSRGEKTVRGLFTSRIGRRNPKSAMNFLIWFTHAVAVSSRFDTRHLFLTKCTKRKNRASFR